MARFSGMKAWAGTPRARWVRRLGLVLVGAAMVWSAPYVARRLEFFQVRRLEFVGLRHLEHTRAVEALGLRPGASVFDDLAALEARLEAIPGVVAATVERRLPGTLVIAVQEWVPVGLAPADGRLALIDRTGRVLPFDPAASAPNLPVMAGVDTVVAGVLAEIQQQAPAFFGDIVSARRVGGDVELVATERRIWFGPQVSAEEIRAVTSVANDLAQRGRTYRELDGRFAGQVVVRGQRSGPGA